MYSFLVNDSSEHKKAKGMNKIVVVTIIHSEYKEFLLNNKCLRRSMNRIQSKNQKIRTSEIINISLVYCDDKEHILNNGYD